MNPIKYVVIVEHDSVSIQVKDLKTNVLKVLEDVKLPISNNTTLQPKLNEAVVDKLLDFLKTKICTELLLKR